MIMAPKRVLILFGCVVFCLSWSPSLWGETFCVLEDVLVTARGHESWVRLTPGGTAVVTKKAFERAQDPCLSHTLAQVPGLEKASDLVWGSGVNIRGLGRNHLVVLVDGCRVNTATDINARFGFINPNEIQRVEVLKGPVSSLYGSGAMGGVVNIITKKGEFIKGSRTRLGLGGGSNPQGWEGFGHTQVGRDDFWMYGFGALRDYDTYEDGRGDEQKNSGFEDQGWSLKSGVQWNPAQTTEARIQYAKGEDIGIPGRGTALPTGPCIEYTDIENRQFSLTHEMDSASGVHWDINVFHQKILRHVALDAFPAGPMERIQPHGRHETWGLKWKNDLDWANSGLTAGLDVWTWKMETRREKYFANGKYGVDTPLAPARQTTAGLFAEEEMGLTPTLNLTLGGRMDWIHTRSNDQYSWIIPPNPGAPVVLKRKGDSGTDWGWDARVGLAWECQPDLTMDFLLAAAYRSPDLMDRYKYLAFNGGEIYGNPDLDPERSWFVEYDLHYTLGDLGICAAVYGNFIRDMIREKDQGDGTYLMKNLDRVTLWGWELELSYHGFIHCRPYADLAYVRGKKRGENLASVPPLNGHLGLAGGQGDSGFWWDFNLQWADGQDKTAPGENATPGWATLNASGGAKANWGVVAPPEV